MNTVLSLPDKIYQILHKHLVRKNQMIEEAAFIFAEVKYSDNKVVLYYKDLYLVKPDDYVFQSAYHIELNDELRKFLIKEAHKLDCSLIELHSHINQKKAKFSISDLDGFTQFVPHVLWRLKDKPYLAIVFSYSSYDALVWLKKTEGPRKLDYIKLNTRKLLPTNESIREIIND